MWTPGLLGSGCAQGDVAADVPANPRAARSVARDVPSDEALLARVHAAGSNHVPEPAEVDPAVSKLGYYLFFEPALSGGRDESCSSCHQKNFFHGFPTPFPLGST